MTKNIINTGLNFDASFSEQLKGFYTPSKGDKLSDPKIMAFNQPLAKEIGLNYKDLSQEELAHLLTGSIKAQGSNPFAQVYAGHQFGGFSPQLGDGRAIMLAEIIDENGLRKDIHLKGSGQTPYSRGGDGKAAVGPVLREYLLGEAMHALGIPATRGLAATLTGEQVMRDRLLPGAVVARVASSHIRVGTFQFFAAKGEQDKVKLLADYTINRHFPELKNADNPYLELLRSIQNRQAQLISQWMLVGFVHGVMNTDNMVVSGETIDFGPCAFIDNYDANASFSSIDRQGRYAYSNQPYMAQWNTARFAECLLHLLDEDSEKAIAIATEEIQEFTPIYQKYWLQGMNNKLGLSHIESGDFELANELIEAFKDQNIDYTQFFRSLSQAIDGDEQKIHDLFDHSDKFKKWYKNWINRLLAEDKPIESTIESMNAFNPIYIPRNHLVEEALQAAEQDSDLKPFEKLLSVLTSPYVERTGLEKYTKPAPKEFGPYKTFCGT